MKSAILTQSGASFCAPDARLPRASLRAIKRSKRSRVIPKVSIIIVNYNAGDWLTRCALSVAAQTHINFECFIIDNGSSDSSIADLPKLDDRFEIVELGENTGFARGNNIGAKKATGDWLALLNPDAFAAPNWLEALLAETARPDVTMVGSTQMMALEPFVFDGLGDCYHITGLAWRAGFAHPVDKHSEYKTCEVFGPCAAAALYHRETFIRLGGFDETFFCYHEDVDIAFRFRLDGGRCIQSADAKVDHVSSGISGRASDFAVYHGTRNRMWTFVKCMPLPALILLAPLHIALNLALLTWSAFRPGRFSPTARGVRDGIKGLPAVWRRRKTLSRRASVRQLLRMMSINPLHVVTRGLQARGVND